MTEVHSHEEEELHVPGSAEASTDATLFVRFIYLQTQEEIYTEGSILLLAAAPPSTLGVVLWLQFILLAINYLQSVFEMINRVSDIWILFTNHFIT